MLPLPAESLWVSLGEGGTPLVGVRVRERQVFFKCEHLNPTGSFKDRGSAVLVSLLRAAGVRRAIEDSSGNAGSSFAAYAARAGISARVFVPDSASPAKRDQIASYGAEVVRILGPRTAAAEAAQRAAAGGADYASHAYLPLGQPGLATLAYEIVEQLGKAPGSLILPVGQGTLLLGCAAGFEAMVRARAIERGPQLVGVQAQACAPLWAVHTGGAARLAWVQEGPTRAEGIRILQPLRGDAVLSAVEASGGWIVAVGEEDIQDGEHELARLGLYVEPTSAVVWPAVLGALSRLADPVVVVLTGSGYKHSIGESRA
jgi:threonine synthase